MKRILLVLLALLPLTATAAELKPLPHSLTVAVSSFPPCVIRQADGTLSGFDIELWQAIAKELKVHSTFKLMPQDALLGSIAGGQAQVGMAGITIDAQREKTLDFSYGYLRSGLRILVLKHSKPASLIITVGHALFNREMLKVLGLICIFLVICGFILWVAERGHDDIDAKFKKGFPDAIWCSLAIATTIGFGDIAPRRWLGRLITIPIFLAGVVVLGVVISQVNSTLMVQKLNLMASTINGPEDLAGKRVATVRGTTSVTALAHLHAKVVAVDNITDAYAALADEGVDAVVYDNPNLLYYATHAGAGKVTVVGPIFDEQDYGIAMVDGSPLREPINRALLKLRENGVYDQIHSKWFGQSPGKPELSHEEH